MQKDRRRAGLVDAFRNFANGPKNEWQISIWHIGADDSGRLLIGTNVPAHMASFYRRLETSRN